MYPSVLSMQMAVKQQHIIGVWVVEDMIQSYVLPPLPPPVPASHYPPSDSDHIIDKTYRLKPLAILGIFLDAIVPSKSKVLPTSGAPNSDLRPWVISADDHTNFVPLRFPCVILRCRFASNKEVCSCRVVHSSSASDCKAVGSLNADDTNRHHAGVRHWVLQGLVNSIDNQDIHELSCHFDTFCTKPKETTLSVMLGISKDGYVRQQRDRSFTPPTVTLDNVCAATAHRITLNFACLSCQFQLFLKLPAVRHLNQTVLVCCGNWRWQIRCRYVLLTVEERKDNEWSAHSVDSKHRIYLNLTLKIKKILHI